MVEKYGFQPGRSTTMCSVVFSNYDFDEFNSHSQVDVIFLDITKAFDRVNYNITLLKMLGNFGVGELLRSKIQSFIKDRISWVYLHSIKSDRFILSSGVPQGSHLSSPILSHLYQ